MGDDESIKEKQRVILALNKSAKKKRASVVRKARNILNKM